MRITKPHLFDNGISDSKVKLTSPPDSRFSYKIGTKIVRDNILAEAAEINLKEAFQSSHFSKKRGSGCRGLKHGSIKLCRSPNGGFVHSPRINRRLELDSILD